MRDDEYCGFLCGEVIDKQEELLDEIRDLSKYNPGLAIEMLEKLSHCINKCRLDLDGTVVPVAPV